MGNRRTDEENRTLAGVVAQLKKQAPAWGIERETAAFFTAIAPKVGGVGRPILEMLADELEDRLPRRKPTS